MKIREGFSIREIRDRVYVIDETGEAPKMHYLNETGVFLWELCAQGLTVEAMKQKILDEYVVDEATVKADIADFLAGLRQIGALEND